MAKPERGPAVTEHLGEIGEALVEVYRAEGRSLRQKLADWLQVVRSSALLLSIAAAIGFWAVGALVTTAIAALGLVLPLWAAAGVVCAALVVVAAVLALWVRHRLSALDNPSTLMSRQLEDHVEWWRSQVLDSTGPESSRGTAQGRTEEGE